MVPKLPKKRSHIRFVCPRGRIRYSLRPFLARSKNVTKPYRKGKVAVNKHLSGRLRKESNNAE